MSTYADDLAFANALADAADTITTHRFQSLDLRVERKPDRTPVTDADTAVEKAIRAQLAEHRPHDAIVGEEEGGVFTESGRMWVLDPIDGTKNFLRGVPVWATLIALVEEGAAVVGVVSSPALGRRWLAARGEGAFLQDTAGRRPISVSGVSDLSDAYLSTTDIASWPEHHSQTAYLDLVDACWETRAFGDFWQHCLVAEGAIDVAAEAIVNPWDVAVIDIIVTEAGGRFSDLEGNPGFQGGSALATNGLLHEPALAILGQYPKSVGPKP